MQRGTVPCGNVARTWPTATARRSTMSTACRVVLLSAVTALAGASSITDARWLRGMSREHFRTLARSRELAHPEEAAALYVATLDEAPLGYLYNELKILTGAFVARDSIGLSASEAQSLLDAACTLGNLLLEIRADRQTIPPADVAMLWPEQQSMRCWPLFVKQYGPHEHCEDLLAVSAQERGHLLRLRDTSQCKANCEFRAHVDVDQFHNGDLMDALARLGEVLARLGRSADAERYIAGAAECMVDRLFSAHAPLDAHGRLISAPAADVEWSWRLWLLTCTPCTHTPQALNHAGKIAMAADQLARAIATNGEASRAWVRSGLPGRLREVAKVFVAGSRNATRRVRSIDGAQVLRWSYHDYSECPELSSEERAEDVNHGGIDVEIYASLFGGGDNPYGLTLDFMQALMRTFLHGVVVNGSATDYTRFACDIRGETGPDSKSCNRKSRTGDDRVISAAKWLVLPNTLLAAASASTTSLAIPTDTRSSIGNMSMAMVASVVPPLAQLFRGVDVQQFVLLNSNNPWHTSSSVDSVVLQIAQLPDASLAIARDSGAELANEAPPADGPPPTPPPTASSPRLPRAPPLQDGHSPRLVQIPAAAIVTIGSVAAVLLACYGMWSLGCIAKRCSCRSLLSPGAKWSAMGELEDVREDHEVGNMANGTTKTIPTIPR